MRRFRWSPCSNYRVSYLGEIKIFETDLGYLFLFLFLLAMACLPFFVGSYLLYVITLMGINIIAALGLNILTGFTGQISIGHAAFLGVGAYASGILATKLGFPFLLALPAAGLIASLVGLIFGLPSLRLKGLYLAIATLAAQFIIEYGIIHWESLTRGTAGISMPKPTFFGKSVGGDRPFFYMTFSIVFLMLFFSKNLIRTRIGRAFIAIRDNDRAAEAMGINLWAYKLLAFAVGAFYAGVAGCLWAYCNGAINPEQFNIGLSIEYLAMIIIGGLGSNLGSIFGAVFLTSLYEILRVLAEYILSVRPQLMSILMAIREFVFGLIIVIFLIFEPDGLAERWRVLKAYFRLWPFSY